MAIPELNVQSKKFIDKLYTVKDTSFRSMKHQRQFRKEAIRMYLGVYYSPRGAKKKQPVNMLELAVNTFLHRLAAKNPNVVITTTHAELKPQALTFELAMNHLLDEIDFEKTLRSAVLDALFGIGVIKTGLGVVADVEIEGYLHDIAQPFADTVDLDDLLIDMSARDVEEADFIGNRFRLPIDYIRDSELYENFDDLKPMFMDNFEDGEEKIRSLSKTRQINKEELREFVELWEIWLPKENIIITIPEQRQDKAVRIVEWDGPERGPYEFLMFNNVPDNVFPLPPVALWRDLNELINGLMRKQERQSSRQKDLLAYESKSAKDAERIINASDGESVRVNNLERIRQISYGGANPISQNFMILARQIFNDVAGNLQLLGGLAAQSQTVGQDQLLNQNASVRVTDMQDRTVGFTSQVVRKMAFYLWTDPLIEIPLIKRIPGTDIEIPVTFSPEDREGDFLDYNFEIEPFSMQKESPQTKVSKLQGFIQNTVLPLQPLMEAQGLTINFEQLFQTFARFLNIKDLGEIVISSGNLPTVPQPDAVGRLPVTHRINERISRAGTVPRGLEQQLMQANVGLAQQPGQVQQTASGGVPGLPVAG